MEGSLEGEMNEWMVIVKESKMRRIEDEVISILGLVSINLRYLIFLPCPTSTLPTNK